MADKQDYLSMINQDPDLKSTLVDMGQQALASGKVTPAQARKTMVAMGAKKTDVPTDDYISSYLSKAQSSPYDFGPGPDASEPGQNMTRAPAADPSAPLAMSAPQPQTPSPVAVGAGAPPPQTIPMPVAKMSKNTATTKTNANNTIFQGQDQVNANAQNIRALPEMQAQQQGIKSLQDRYDQIAAMGTNSDAAWIKPLAALADSTTGSKLSAGYEPGGMTPAQRNAELLKYADAIQKAKQDNASSLLKGMSELKAGNSQATNLNISVDGTNTGGAGGKGDPTQNLISKLQTQALSQRGDQATTQAEKDLYSASKVNSLANLYGDPNKLNTAQVNTLVSEIGKMASGGVPTEGELKGMQPNTWTGAVAEAYGKMKNDPQPANAAAFIKTYTDYAKALGEDAKQRISDRYSNIFDPYEAQLGNDPRFRAMSDQFKNRFKQAQASGGGGGGTTPARTKALTDMTQAELDAYETSLTKGK